MYGKEIIIDLIGCDVPSMQRKNLEKFFIELADLAKMERVQRPYFWKETSNIPHLKGMSGVQFIKTSNILIHTLDITKTAYINFFSCKDFNVNKVVNYCKKHFGAEFVNYVVITRGNGFAVQYIRRS
jgi:S-adenosylmethionine decarboxylase